MVVTPPFLEIGLAAVWRAGPDGVRVLVTRRPAGTHLAGYWELPGGKVESGESPETSARRELTEETGIRLDDRTAPAERLLVVEHAYPDRTVRLHVFLLQLPEAFDDTHAPGLERRWVLADELNTLSFPPANDAIIRAIMNRLTTD